MNEEMAANDDSKRSKVIMYSLVTFRYISTVQALFFCTFEMFGARAFNQRSLSTTGTHTESELGTCKLCAQFLLYLQSGQRDGRLQVAFVKSRSRCCRPVKAQPHVCGFRLGSGLDWMPVNVAPYFILFRGDGDNGGGGQRQCI